MDDSKGITLRSLGGIFLATLFGLLLSLVTLGYEMWQQKKEEKKATPPSPATPTHKVRSKLEKDVLESIAGGEPTRTIAVGKKKIRVTNLGNFSPPPSAALYDYNKY